LWYILTVVAPDSETGKLGVQGLYIGRDVQCYEAACELSLRLNFTLLEKPVKRMVTFLDPDEFHSTWLGNKAIYRTRMAMADGGHLIVLAPGINKFGEDSVVDQLIRKYGYKGTPATMKAVSENPDELGNNLSAAAHLIHGSTEGRFTVTYCPDTAHGGLTREEIEGVGFLYGDFDEHCATYGVVVTKGQDGTSYELPRDGWHNQNDKDDGEGEDGENEPFYFISNPALGLWAVPSRFNNGSDDVNAKEEEGTGDNAP